MSTKNRSKLAFGIALFVLGIILLFGGSKKTVEIPTTASFKDEPVVAQGFSQDDNQESEIPEKIIIPSLNIDLNVEKSKIINGYWEVFEDKAGWGEGSGYPGKNGNQVIFAHAREELFLPLQLIKPETIIYVLTDNSWYKYKVFEIREVNPNQIEVIAQTDDETLTLYTCSGYKDSKRLIVTAKRSV